jgi:peptide/nickel transport system substrate-binding protein
MRREGVTSPMSRDRPAILLLASAILIAACQGAAVPSPTSTTARPAAASVAPTVSAVPAPIDYDALLFGSTYEPSPGTPGGRVVVGDWQAANQLNPYFSNAFTDFEVIAATMHTLLTVANDGHYRPDLSDGPITFKDNVTEDADGKGGFTVRVKVKPGLKWSDGQPFTLNDMKFTWQWVLDKAQVGIGTLGWEQVDRIDVADDGLSADIHFPKPFAGWLGVVGSNAILPEHSITTIPVKDAAARTYPVSAELAKSVTIGPFKYVTATADTIELARDDNWAGPSGACPGRTCLDGLTYKFFPDNKEGEIAAFLNGEVDVALGLAQTDYDAIKGVDPSVGTAILEPGWLYEHFDMNQAGLGPGRGHPALQDLVVRSAIARAIDKKALWETIFPGSPYPDNNPCTNATPTNYWQLPDAKCLPFDVAAANSALDAAGYTKGADGVRIDPKSKLPLTFLNCTLSNGFRQVAADFLAKSLQQVGIRLDNEFVDGTSVMFAGWADVKADTKCNLAHGNYDTAEFAYVLGFDLYGDYYYSYHSEQIPTDANKGNGYNSLRLKSPEMDAAIDVLAKAIKPADQVEATYTIQQVYIDQIPEIVMYYRNEARGVNAKLQNFKKNPSTASDVWNAQDWWLKP